MEKKLDPDAYRDVTTLLFPSATCEDAAIALQALNTQFGRGNGMTAILDGVPVNQLEPSGLLVRCVGGRIVRVWAPLAIEHDQIARWRAGIVAALSPMGSAVVTRVLLCAGPIEHRWELPHAGIRLYPPPAAAPRAPMLMADHPAMIEVRVGTCADASVNGTLANRRVEWCTLLLNMATYIRCAHTLRGRNGWAWDRVTEDRSKWLDFEYFSPELLDASQLAMAATQAAAGVWADDADYYLGFGASQDHAATLPISLDDTLAAAASLSIEHKTDLRRACRWIHAADEAGPASTSLAFVALVAAVETLAKNWQPTLRATSRFKQFLTDMLPCYQNVQDAAGELYRLRCDLVHDGLVFPDDWIDRPEGEDRWEAAALWTLSRVARLATVNWLRTRTGLPHVPGAGDCARASRR